MVNGTGAVVCTKKKWDFSVMLYISVYLKRNTYYTK